MSTLKSQKEISLIVREFLIGLPRSRKQLIAVTTDAVGFAVCTVAVIWLLNEEALSTDGGVRITLATTAIALVIAWSQGLYQSVVRYIGYDVLVAGASTAAGAALVGSTFLYIDGVEGAPMRWALAYWGGAFICLCGSRYLARSFLVHRKLSAECERVVIFGAGDAGAQLAIQLRGDERYVPVAMVDDDVALHKKRVKGLIVESPSNIESVIRNTGATCVLLAMPNASHRERRAVLELLAPYPVHVQTIPDVTDLISGKARIEDIRDVEVEDLLGRDPVPPDPELLSAAIYGKRVMVTGAGGSIGSELCRRILQQEPKSLVLFEISEIALYEMEHELKPEADRVGCELVPLLGSVRHLERVREVLKTFRINTIYHAAAYKHVPIVEFNLIEGVRNNIFGTLHVAQAAIDAKVDNFILISTDKTVSPTSVMGATKRFAEMILQALQVNHRDICFCIVRFGNVLESSGSVVPLFRRQIREGGPVTVTHRDIFRYFMTIPEATQLVIQAGGMAKGGEVFVLDMGEPVRIRDLAERMILLAGRTVCDESNPDGDIEIQYTGLRPAEKLYEELLIGTNVSGTRHPRIMWADEEFLTWNTLEPLISELEQASQAMDCIRARRILMESVSEYYPANGIDDIVWVNQQVESTGDTPENVVDFPPKSA